MIQMDLDIASFDERMAMRIEEIVARHEAASKAEAHKHVVFVHPQDRNTAFPAGAVPCISPPQMNPA